MLALIDTGADEVYVDPAVISRRFMATIGYGSVSAANNIVDGSRSVLADLSFPTIRRSIRLRAWETALHSTGREYGLLLGRSFLRAGILHLDYLAGEHWFEFGPAS